MATMDPAQLLNRLLNIVYRSFPAYVTDTIHRSPLDQTPIARQIKDIVTTQQQYADRVAALIQKRQIPLYPGTYPLDYTDTHFVALEHLLPEMIAYQKEDISHLEGIAVGLGSDKEAKELAEEVLGCFKGHLESLEELAGVTPSK